VRRIFAAMIAVTAAIAVSASVDVTKSHPGSTVGAIRPPSQAAIWSNTQAATAHQPPPATAPSRIAAPPGATPPSARPDANSTHAAAPRAALANSAPAKATPPKAAPAIAAAGTNLLVNPDAETGLCTQSGYDAMTVPGWSVTAGSPDSVCYGAIGFPKADVPGPPDRGRAFFSGGATGDGAMTQTLSVASAADRIDGGGVQYRASGWLGGWAGQNDRSTVTISFVDSHGKLLGSDLLQTATNTDRDGVTALQKRSTGGWLPSRTRAVILSVAFTWTTGNTTDGYVDDLAFTLSTPMKAPQLLAPASNVPAFDHVFVVMMENQNALPTEAPTGSGHYILGNRAAPYLNQTVTVMGSTLGQMYATTHPSDPNYLALSGGSTFGWTTNPVVGTDTIDARHIGDQLDAAGLTWKGYAAGAYGGCDTTNHNTEAGGYYLPDAEPFMLYRDVVGNPQRCAAHNQPLTTLATDLQSVDTTPSLAWFAANDVNDMEDGGVAAGDRWLSQTLPAIFSSPAWTQQRSLLIISWDEGHDKSFGPDYPNHVATYVIGSQDMVKPGYTSPVRYTDFSLGRTIEDALGVGPLTSNDRYATPLGDIWNDQGGGARGHGGQGNDGGSTVSLRSGPAARGD
jgi:Phosphoesterase family